MIEALGLGGVAQRGDPALMHLARDQGRVVGIVASLGRPRLLRLSDRPARVFNALMLSCAGLSMMTPVPIISFDGTADGVRTLDFSAGAA